MRNKITGFIKSHGGFFALLLTVAITRFFILFISQTHVHSDEAIIGLMAKKISRGGYFPLYMFGQPYNGGAAIEAYVAAAAFLLFGAGAVVLKGCMVTISLVTLTVFYFVVNRFWNLKIALISAVIFAVFPPLLKWHFQVRGYSPYFLFIVVLFGILLSIQTAPKPRLRTFFIFGLATGLGIWALELIVSVAVIMWLAVVISRKVSVKMALSGLLGFLCGYFPAIMYNLENHYRNWRVLFFNKTTLESIRTIIRPEALSDIFCRDLPKFFGTDTTFWYYPEIPISGVICYCLFCMIIVAMLIKNIRSVLPWKKNGPGQKINRRELLLVALIVACFFPFLFARLRVPGYFLSSCIFLSILAGSFAYECFRKRTFAHAACGSAVIFLILGCGCHGLVKISKTDHLEILALNAQGHLIQLPIPGRDIDDVLQYLKHNNVTNIWTTISLVYPVNFCSDEKIGASSAIFGFNYTVHPEGVVDGTADNRMRTNVVLLETGSPFLKGIVEKFIKYEKTYPRISQFGTLSVIESGLAFKK
jgi:4-amino-4-deoxy-L-arabinose transferase-like glycosyltransferase